MEIENIADSLGACFKNDNKNAWLLVTEQKDMSEIPISKVLIKQVSYNLTVTFA